MNPQSFAKEYRTPIQLARADLLCAPINMTEPPQNPFRLSSSVLARIGRTTEVPKDSGCSVGCHFRKGELNSPSGVLVLTALVNRLLLAIRIN